MPITVYSTPSGIAYDSIDIYWLPWDNTSLTIPSISDEATIAQAVSITGNNKTNDTIITANLVYTFSQDYYNRIHVIPEIIDFGIILTLREEEFLVWNAFIYEDKTCTSVDDTNGSEVTITGPTPTFIIPALGTANYTVEVDQNGSASFVMTREFNFTGLSYVPMITIKGIRALIIIYRPQQPFVEKLVWFTDVLQANDGTEYKQCLRVEPRQEFELNFKLTVDQMRDFEAEIYTQLKGAWGIPVWPEAVKHTSGISSGISTITFDTTKGDFRAGEYMILWQSSQQEVVTIETVSATYVTLELPTTNTFTGLTYLIPVRIGYIMDGRVKKRRFGNNYTLLSMIFRTNKNAEITGFTPDDIFKSKTLILDPIGIESALDEGYDAEIFESDYYTGKFLQDSDTELNRSLKNIILYADTPAKVWYYRQMFHSLKGRQKSLYVPTYFEEIRLIGTVGVSDTVIEIENHKFYDYYGVQANRKGILFEFSDEIIARELITDVYTSPTVETITISSALGREATNSNCKIHYIELVCASDELEIKWTDIGKAEFRTTLIGTKE